MQNSLLKEIINIYRSGSVVIQFIFINVAVWLIISIISVVFFLFNKTGDEFYINILSWLALPANLKLLIFKPWTLISYMFLHVQFLHILFNMLWLYWFGKIFIQFLDEKQFISTYIFGGLAGAFLYILAFNVFPVFQNVLPSSMAIGASASVLAIVIAISTYVPNYTIFLLFFGPIKIKYIALISVIIDILMIKSGNTGGHIAHLGGALYGYLFIVQYRKGYDFSKGLFGFLNFFKSILPPYKRKMRIEYKRKRPLTDEEYNAMKANKQKRIDEILDKIAKYGYGKLTQEEKDFLFKTSKEQN